MFRGTEKTSKLFSYSTIYEPESLLLLNHTIDFNQKPKFWLKSLSPSYLPSLIVHKHPHNLDRDLGLQLSQASALPLK